MCMFGYLPGFDYLLIVQFGQVSRFFYNEFVDVKEDPFADYFRLVPLGESWVFVEDYITDFDQLSVL